MESKRKLKLTMLTLVALVPLSACQSFTSSSSNRTPQEANLAVDGRKVSPNKQDQPEIRLETLKMFPVDEGPQDSSFAEFRSKLGNAAKDHDAAFILSILHPQIVNSSDGDRGVKEFKEQWKVDHPDSKLWEVLASVVSMGGSFRSHDGHNEFCAPYVTSQWPKFANQLPKGADPLDYQVITEKDVEVRIAPNPNAPLVTTLSHDVVKVHSEASPANYAGWLKITTLGGSNGYVLDKYIRSPTDYQACFEKVGKKWTMTELAARE